MITPSNEAELAGLMAEAGRVLPVGGRTKPRLCQVDDGVTAVSISGLRGILEYVASEYTFTARAGTPVAALVETLREKGQGLPFDPVFAEAGATLGGTVAAGLSGPGRFRFGGIRDFLLGVRYLDGDGVPTRGGGKVVKNAAGFDLPKLMVGSLGRCGVMTELTFKVFPVPVESRTVRIRCADGGEARDRIAAIATSRWEVDALEYHPGDASIYCRLSGPGQAVDALASDIVDHWQGDSEMLDPAAADEMWAADREFAWTAGCAFTAKVPLSLSRLPGLLDAAAGLRVRVGSGGNVAWIAGPEDGVSGLSDALRALGLRGMIFQGGGVPLWLGAMPRHVLLPALERALDRPGKFAGFHDSPTC